MDTPFFIINKNDLDKNVLTFKNSLEKNWPNSILSYSVKTNSLPWLLKYLRTLGIKAEVVSDEEYELALLCGYTKENIIFNGPSKGKTLFLDAIRKGSLVNLDSKAEVELFKKSFETYQNNIGIRVNINPSIFSSDDVWYQDDGYRFGFSEKNDELSDVIDIVRFNDNTNKIGLHFHCNSSTRSVDVYRKIAEYAKYIILKYHISPSYIDIGGGFFGGVEGMPSAPDYISAVYNVLKTTIDINQTTLIVEPGSAIVASAVDFHTTVLDVKETYKSTIITTDGSRINIDPLWSKKNFTHIIKRISEDNQSIKKKQIVCGYTCIEHDRIMILNDVKALSIGDIIIYQRTGAYSATFGGPFIKYFPKVYVKDDNAFELVRKKIDVKDYFNIHSV